MDKRLEKNTWCWTCNKPTDTIDLMGTESCSKCGAYKELQYPRINYSALLGGVMFFSVVIAVLALLVWGVFQLFD